MTNFDKLKQDKEEMAYYLMCPYGVSEDDRLLHCQETNCVDCCMEWLDKEAEPDDC